ANNFQWDSGRLTGATITLGNRIDQASPDSLHYPVTNSVAKLRSSYMVSGDLLAATIIAHEFGHVAHAFDSAVYQLQNRLFPIYESILLTNGHNASDPRLIEIERQMGADPSEISADRECQAEANALLYLSDRIIDKATWKALLKRVQ